MSVYEWADAIEATSIGTAIAESRYAFPIIEGVHLIALSLSVGLIFITDLRLIGVALKEVPVIQVLQQLRVYLLTGFVVVFLTGGLLVWAEARAVVDSPATPFKFAFLLLAGINAAYFEFGVAKSPEILDSRETVLPRGARFAGYASLVLWTLVIIFGRLIAYIPHWT
jgi:hypothetical protein